MLLNYSERRVRKMAKNKNSMLAGNVIKSIIIFSLPIIFSSLIQFNYTLVDNIIVGRYVGTDALAGVGNVASINSFIIGASLGLTSGFSIPIAHAFGEGNKEKIAKYAGNSISLALIVGTVLVVIAHIISRPILRLIGTPDEIINISASYVNILYFGIPFQMLSNNFTAISRAVGESKKPLYFFTVTVILNFTLDLLFIKEFRWGVKGAALATLISHICAALLCGIYVLRFNPNVNVRKESFRPQAKVFMHQMKLGIPISLQFTITSIGAMFLQSAVNTFGKNVMAGLTAASRVENLTNIPMSAFGVGTQTFVGQNYGAGNLERVLKSVKRIFLLDICLSVLMSLILYFIGGPVVSLFMDAPNPEMMAAAKRYILAISQCYSLVAVLFVMRNTLQGLGFTYANAIAGAGELVGRILISMVITPLLGFDAVCYAAPAAWLLADIPLIFIYLSKKRKFRKEIEKQKQKAG